MISILNVSLGTYFGHIWDRRTGRNRDQFYFQTCRGCAHGWSTITIYQGLANYDCVVQPLSALLKDDPPRYKPVVFGEDYYNGVIKNQVNEAKSASDIADHWKAYNDFSMMYKDEM